MRIIGLGHYSRTGKDSFANFFINRTPGSVKKSFAWKLKQTTHELYAWAGLREPEFYETLEGAPLRTVVLPDLGLTPIDIWVKFGTPAVREQVYDKTWIDYVLKSNHNCDILVIPDVRFMNEVEAVREMGGTLIKVVRPGYGPRDTVADRALVGFHGWDYVIGSVGTMESLDEWARIFSNAFWGLTDMPFQSEQSKRDCEAVEVL